MSLYPQHIYAPSSPRAQAAAYEEDELLHDMSDVGLKVGLKPAAAAGRWRAADRPPRGLCRSVSCSPPNTSN